MLVIGRFSKQPKFNPVVRFDLKDPDAVEVRVEGYDTIAYSMNREQYAQFRDAVGRFKPSATPAPAPTPPPPPADDWGN